VDIVVHALISFACVFRRLCFSLLNTTLQDFKQIVTHIFIVSVKLCQYFRLTNSMEQNVVVKLICLI